MESKILKRIESNGMKFWLFEHVDGMGKVRKYTVGQIGDIEPELFDLDGNMYPHICNALQSADCAYIDVIKCISLAPVQMRQTKVGEWLYGDIMACFRATIS